MGNRKPLHVPHLSHCPSHQQAADGLASTPPARGRPRDRLADTSCWRRASYAWRKHATKGTLPRHSTGFRTPRYCRCSCKHLPSFSGEETKFSVQASKLKTLAFESTSRLLAAGGTILSRSQLQRGHIVNCGASGTLLNGSGARYMYLLQSTKVFLD